MKENTNSATPSFGLFNYCWLLHPVRFFKDLSIYRLRMKTFKKKGYSEVAEWETFNWFIDTMRGILTTYRFNRNGTPILSPVPEDIWAEAEKRDKFFEYNSLEYDKLLDKMLVLLEQMDETNKSYDGMDLLEAAEKQEEAKDEFFKLFSKYFYT